MIKLDEERVLQVVALAHAIDNFLMEVKYDSCSELAHAIALSGILCNKLDDVMDQAEME